MQSFATPSRLARALVSRLISHQPLSQARMIGSMATAYQFHITPDNTGLWNFDQSEDTANKASELLQRDLEQHHVFFNQDGFHNHVGCSPMPT